MKLSVKQSIEEKKYCPQCDSYKKLSEFGPDKRKRLGKTAYCYKCDRIRHLTNARRRQSEGFKYISSQRQRLKNGRKNCPSCKKYKNLSEFGSDKTKWHGKTTFCYKCERDRGLEKANRRQSEDIGQYISARFSLYRKNAQRPKYKKKIFKLDKKYLTNLFNNQIGRCAITRVKMTHIVGKGYFSTNASIDRINPKKGYVKKNVRWVCFLINILKQEMNDFEFKGFCKKLVKHG